MDPTRDIFFFSNFITVISNEELIILRERRTCLTTSLYYVVTWLLQPLVLIYQTLWDNFTTKSVIHKAAIQPAAIPNGLWRAFCTAASFDILGIIPGKLVERSWTVRPAALWIALLTDFIFAIFVISLFLCLVRGIIENRYDDLCRRFQSGDPESVAQMYTHNCQLLTYGEPPIYGRKGTVNSGWYIFRTRSEPARHRSGGRGDQEERERAYHLIWTIFFVSLWCWNGKKLVCEERSQMRNW